MGCCIAIQPNGERHQIERWAIQAWMQGRLTDPLILASLVNATEIYDSPRMPWDPSIYTQPKD